MEQKHKMIRPMFYACFCLAVLLPPRIAISGEDPDPADIERELEEFEADPYTYMNTLPKKEWDDGVPEDVRKTANPPVGDVFSWEEPIHAKDDTRAIIIGDNAMGLHDESIHDEIEDILDPVELIRFDGAIVRSLRKMDSRGLKATSLRNRPWSSSYWPVYKGLLGQRYASQGYRKTPKSWRNFYRYISKPGQTIWGLYRSQLGRTVSTLAPAEKYDLLIGNLKDSRKGYLAKANWGKGAEYQKKEGRVERWMGICHGWASAAFMMPRPRRTVTMLAADGKTRVRFYPDDLKGLASELWAYSDPEVRFLGNRCRVGNPRRDRGGRIVDDKCFDVNPGLWHMAVVNQLGNARRNLVIDTTYDYQVWNAPVIGYSYTYFNPRTRKATNSLKAATVSLRRWSRDRFRRWRSPEAVAVVGIAMKIRYMSETNPSTHPTDSPSRDSRKQVTYLYDVELDSSGNIIGGEWYKNAHPDFLWVPPKGSRAESDFDDMAKSRWNGRGRLPYDWREAAKTAAPEIQPLGQIVRVLLRLASRGAPGFVEDETMLGDGEVPYEDENAIMDESAAPEDGEMTEGEDEMPLEGGAPEESEEIEIPFENHMPAGSGDITLTGY